MNCNYIFFDLETSSSTRKSEILQIGAVDVTGELKFSGYVKPIGSINFFASKVNGLTKASNGDLLKNGELISDAKTFSDVWNDFQHFIEMNFSGKIFLVAHNGFRFDGPVLVHNIMQIGATVPKWEMADTLPAFKSYYPGLGTKQSDIVTKFCPTLRGQDHDAEYDTEALREAVMKAAETKKMTIGQFFNDFTKPLQ